MTKTAAEWLLDFAFEFNQTDWTLDKAEKALADAEGDSELAEFLIVALSDWELAKKRYPELIFKYPSLYTMSDEEIAEYDRRIDAAWGI